MAPIYAPPKPAAIHDHALTTSALELKYAQATSTVDLITKDEDIRRLRFDIHTLEDDNDELRELLAQEEDRSDAFERLVNENLARAETAEAQLQDVSTDLREREQELSSLQAETGALKHTTADATAALTEKLALTRELSVLKPELEHLKQQAANTEVLVTEKLALQRQLSEVQCEVENAKRDTKRALAKRRNTGVEIAQEEQVDELKRQLAKEKRARARAEEAAEAVQGDEGVQDVRKELAREKRARQKAEEELEAAAENTQVEDVRRELLKEKRAKGKLEAALEVAQADLEKERKTAAKAAKKADAVPTVDGQAEELKQELANEKKEKAKAEKAVQKAATDLEAQKAVLDEKLNQFRTKLKSTKEKLKETEAELASAREAAAAAPAKQSKISMAPSAAKPTKKRNAAQLDPQETNLGTPGDAPAAKRAKKPTTGLGDKSTFTLTPFLNKTADVSGEDDADSDAEAAVAAEASPAAKKASKKAPLAQQPASKSNVQKPKAAATTKTKPKPALELINEETASQTLASGQENASAPAPAPATKTMKIKTKTLDGDTNAPISNGNGKPKKKVRKSLVDFQSYANEPEAVEHKKKRKLGGLGKTLFDEEEEVTAPARGMPGKAIFGSKGFGGVMGKKGSLLGSSRLGLTGGRSGVGASGMLMAGDGSGFQFSPLKRSRKGLDDTLRG